MLRSGENSPLETEMLPDGGDKLHDATWMPQPGRDSRNAAVLARSQGGVVRIGEH